MLCFTAYFVWMVKEYYKSFSHRVAGGIETCHGITLVSERNKICDYDMLILLLLGIWLCLMLPENGSCNETARKRVLELYGTLTHGNKKRPRSAESMKTFQ